MSVIYNRVALIGLGMVAETHLRAIAELGDIVTLRGAFARSEKSISQFTQLAADLLPVAPIIYDSVDHIAADGYPNVPYVHGAAALAGWQVRTGQCGIVRARPAAERDLHDEDHKSDQCRHHDASWSGHRDLLTASMFE